MNVIERFASRFNASLTLDDGLVVKSGNRFFLVEPTFKTVASRGGFFYAGLYLGKVKGKLFFPSFILLSMLATERANKIIVDAETAWLFICGRDVFKRGMLSVQGSKRKGDYTLVLNERNECLGFGRIQCSITEESSVNTVIVKNVSDVGDFLRREKPP